MYIATHKDEHAPFKCKPCNSVKRKQ